MHDTPLLPVGFARPVELRTPDAWLRQQRIDDAEADFEAVMASREKLRTWGGDAWPEDDFTLDENRADLAGHIADADSLRAFGYTIWGADVKRVLGSLYLEPTAPFIDEFEERAGARAALASCDVRVELWLRSDVDGATERRIVAAVLEWLDHEWPFARPCWGSRAGMTRRREALESLGLGEIAVLDGADGSRRFHFHARPI